MKRVLFFIFLLPATLFAEEFSRTRVLMGDVPVTLTIDTKRSRRDTAFSAMEAAFGEAQRLENSISEWRENSQATRLNRNAGEALVPIDREMTELLLKAGEVSTITDGAFDITFASRNKSASFRDVIVLPELGLAYLRPGVTIGVSGIAKGFIVDRMAAVLRQAGFKRFLVNAGDLYGAGKWKVGIRNPDKPGAAETLCEIEVKDEAVSTSGLYERGPHIIDPSHPMARLTLKGIRSTTVIAKTSTEADALATGLFVLASRDEASELTEAASQKYDFVIQKEQRRPHGTKPGSDHIVDSTRPCSSVQQTRKGRIEK